jgi:tetratricopeptide (TPR) repeat protein
MAERKLTTVLIVLLCPAALLAAEDSPAKTSTPPGFRRTPPETSAKVRVSVVSVVNYGEDDHALAQATGFFVAPGHLFTSRQSLANASRGELRLSSGKNVPIAGIVAEDKRLNLAMISAAINANDGPALQLAPSDPREGAPVSMIGTDSQPSHTACEGIISSASTIPEIGTILHVTEAVPSECSGCPLLDSKGHVVAMVMSQQIRGRGIRFVVPASALRRLTAGVPQMLRSWAAQHSRQFESEGLSDGAGILAWNTSRYEQATAYRMAAQTDQADPGLWLLAAERFDELGLLQDAVEACRNTLRAKPDCALAHHNLGLAYGRLGRPRDAASEFEQALRINPTQTGTQYDLGVAYEEMGMLQEAIDAYRKALSLSPDTEQIYYNLGVTYCKLGRWREAVHAFEETIRITPGSADAHYNLGLARLALCQTSKALQQQRDLSSLDKERADKLFHFIKTLECAAARNRVIPRPAAARRNAP